MTGPTEATPSPPQPQPRWQPVSAIDRRVLGVLVEKAKTTPDAYPMSVNAISTGANQKNNRHPLMQLEPDDVEESLERLRGLGAVGLVQGVGRVQKYRHYLYDWLGVDKVELAVMAELLLRGAQTEGELRGRAARMEPIADLAALRPVLQSLKAKGLVIPLTPEGRGHILTHALYQPRELEKVRAEAGSIVAAVHDDAPDSTVASPSAPVDAPTGHGPAPRTAAAVIVGGDVAAVRSELAELRSQLAALRQELGELADRFERSTDDLRQLKQSLGV